jgi:predicted transglutaminase-like cysteine proteinase
MNGLLVVGIILVTLCASPACAADAEIKTAGQVPTPIGWVNFCKHAPEAEVDCVAHNDDRKVVLKAANQSDATWRLIEKVNRDVNKEIKPVLDNAQWKAGAPDVFAKRSAGKVSPEKWSYPTKKRPFGDCEDFAMLKSARLAQAGLPRGALLLTVTEVISGPLAPQLHIVLTVRTTLGDYILDVPGGNLRIQRWDQTLNRLRYKYRQSSADPNIWRAIVTSPIIAPTPVKTLTASVPPPQALPTPAELRELWSPIPLQAAR